MCYIYWCKKFKKNSVNDDDDDDNDYDDDYEDEDDKNKKKYVSLPFCVLLIGASENIKRKKEAVYCWLSCDLLC